ncbi:MAG TPA: mechanosensitive ion channel [Crocinitomix sp.]|nr:mechanosensitive ion channel [Crocinitomix sp.]
MVKISDLGPLSQLIIEKSNNFLQQVGMSDKYIILGRTLILLIIIILLSLALWWMSRVIMITVLHHLAGKSKTKWDDYLVEKRFFAAIAHLVPLLFMDSFIKLVFIDYPKISTFFLKTADIAIIFVILIAIIRFLSTFEKILSEKSSLKDKPIQSYFQLTKILVSGFMIILGLSIASGQSPLYFLTSLGAATAILLLVFKDTILGFVGSIQLAANDMVRIGDWITMEKYGADGDVIEITLATVKVQNFDKTITTIPTYSFISDSFKNWRGMEQSEGRRIKRSISIEMNSIKFCSAHMLNELEKIEYLTNYIQEKEKEIEKYNKENNVKKEFLLNGRHQTNIGLYREYIKQYLKHNPHINQNMTLMVRQLSPTPNGVPIEIYCFSKIKEWTIYENIVADIFDHLFSATTYFDLVIYEQPSGKDLTDFANKITKRN